MRILKIPKTFEQSFASHAKSQYWSELNELKPRQLCKSSNKKFWFDCNKCDHSFNTGLNSIISGVWCPYCTNQKLCEKEDCNICFEKSFVSHLKSKYWSNKNKLKPRDVFKSTATKFLFNCVSCNHEINKSLNDISSNNSWCGYCNNKILCEKENCIYCFEKSFESSDKNKYWSNKNSLLPRQVFKSTNNKYIFNCNNCNHEFNKSMSTIYKGEWCPYCSSKQLCQDKDCNICLNKSFASHPKSKFWSVKNKVKPKEVFKGSSSKYWFDCNICLHDFEMILSNISTLNRWCPKCKNKTELKLLNWFKKQQLNINLQVKFNWCKNKQKLPYDFTLEELKLIIELDGPQHFEQVSNWQSPEETKVRDDFKNISALENGYSIIRICQRIVWNDLEDWDNQLFQVIKNYDKPILIKIGTVYKLNKLF